MELGSLACDGVEQHEFPRRCHPAGVNEVPAVIGPLGLQAIARPVSQDAALPHRKIVEGDLEIRPLANGEGHQAGMERIPGRLGIVIADIGGNPAGNCPFNGNLK